MTNLETGTAKQMHKICKIFSHCGETGEIEINDRDSYLAKSIECTQKNELKAMMENSGFTFACRDFPQWGKKILSPPYWGW